MPESVDMPVQKFIPNFLGIPADLVLNDAGAIIVSGSGFNIVTGYGFNTGVIQYKPGVCSHSIFNYTNTVHDEEKIVSQITHWIKERYYVNECDTETVFGFIKENNLQANLLELPQIIYEYFTPADNFSLALKVVRDNEIDEVTLFLFIRSNHDVKESMNRLWTLDGDDRLRHMLDEDNKIMIDVLFE